MDSSQLTTVQAKELSEAIRPKLFYLTQVQQRMEEKHFPPSDKLYQAVVKAQAAMQHLYMETHYLACKSGVGQPDRE